MVTTLLYRRTSWVTTTSEQLEWPHTTWRKRANRLVIFFKVAHGRIAISVGQVVHPNRHTVEHTQCWNSLQNNVYEDTDTDTAFREFPRTIKERKTCPSYRHLLRICWLFSQSPSRTSKSPRFKIIICTTLCGMGRQLLVADIPKILKSTHDSLFHRFHI